MRLFVPLLVLACLCLRADQSVSPVGFSDSAHSVSAFSPSGEVTLQAVRTQLDIRHADGKNSKGDLTVIYDAQTGHYLWRFIPASHPGDKTNFLDALNFGGAVYSGPDGISDFAFGSTVGIFDSRESAGSLAAAQRSAIDEILRRLPALEKNGYDPGIKAVPLYRQIDNGFACDPLEPRANCGFTGHFISVDRIGENWRLVVRNRWDQEIILDNGLNLISTRRLPTPGK